MIQRLVSGEDKDFFSAVYVLTDDTPVVYGASALLRIKNMEI